MLAYPNLFFTGDRDATTAYLPPCALPGAWAVRAEIWRSTFRPEKQPNRALPACASCSVADYCRFDDPEALDAATLSALEPVRGAVPWESRRRDLPVPPTIVAKRPRRDVVCVAPWTTMDLHVTGRVHQCCVTWTIGHRGDVAQASLEEIWNAEGFRAARRRMSGDRVGELCLDICPRLYDRKFEERRLCITPGSERFVKNQLLLAEDIAERREVVRGKPLQLSICPSTYCNYDCIMCVHGRTPRRDIDQRLWEELPAFLPTLRTLTLLGGEPLANPEVMGFLRELDGEAWPDVTVDVVTNGSLLTAKALEHMKHCAFGDVTVSLNAGSPDVYAQVMRHGDLAQVLKNVDALIAWRARQPRFFGISLSLVVQPENQHDLVEFGRRALERNLRIRLIPLNPAETDAPTFYEDPDEVARVLEGLDRFAAFADRARPEWREEIGATRAAIAQHPGRGRVSLNLVRA